MGARSVAGRWSLELGGLASANADDRIVAAIDLDGDLWHAGGIQVHDGVLAVPLTGGDPVAGEIRFYDVVDPTGPQELDARIARDRSLYATALTRFADGRFLVLLWDDDVIELVRSASADLADGFDAAPTIIATADVDGGFAGGGCGLPCGTYQAMNFVRDCDGRLFVIGTRNEQKAAPVMAGADLATLYELTGADGDAPAMSFVARREFACDDGRCSFAAAAGVYIVDDTHLALYSAYHWLQDDGARLAFDELAE
jgi:hypothetical protein